MEPFRGKASGKTPRCRHGAAHHPKSSLQCGECLQEARKRIAELEAELRSAKNNSETWERMTAQARARAEKAEAEVERLSLLQKKATPRTEWTPTEEERKILDFAVSRIPEDRRDQKRRPLRNGLPNVNDGKEV